MLVLCIKRIFLGKSQETDIGKESYFSLYVFLCFWILDNMTMLFIQNFKLKGYAQNKNLPHEIQGERHLSVPTVADCPNSIFWTAQQHPAWSSHSTSIRASVLFPALMCLARYLEKVSKEIIRTETNTLIFAFSQKGLFLPEA